MGPDLARVYVNELFIHSGSHLDFFDRVSAEDIVRELKFPESDTNVIRDALTILQKYASVSLPVRESKDSDEVREYIPFAQFSVFVQDMYIKGDLLGFYYNSADVLVGEDKSGHVFEVEF